MLFRKVLNFCLKYPLTNIFLIAFICNFSNLQSARPANRHLPFWTELDRVSENNLLTSSLFFTEASWNFMEKDRRPQVFRPFGGMDINLKDLNSSYNAFFTESGKSNKQYLDGYGPEGLAKYQINDLIFEPYLETNIQGAEFALYKKWENVFDSSVDQIKFLHGLNNVFKNMQVFIGAQIPVMTAYRTAEYQPQYSVRVLSNEAMNERMRQVLREFASDAQIKIDYWSQTGFGDLNIYAGVGKKFDYVLRFASIDLSAAFGATFPTGKKFDLDCPLSFSFGREALVLHANFMAKLELQRGMTVGGTLEWCGSSNSTELRRMPLKNEPDGWSPLISEVGIKTGSMFRFSPYVSLQNFMDWWLDISAGFSYLTASSSRWTDPRTNPTINSFISKANPENLQSRVENSAWDAKFLHLKASVDPDSWNGNWSYKPVFWFAYDHPLEREVDILHKKLAIGMSIKF